MDLLNTFVPPILPILTIKVATGYHCWGLDASRSDHWWGNEIPYPEHGWDLGHSYPTVVTYRVYKLPFLTMTGALDTSCSGQRWGYQIPFSDHGWGPGQSLANRIRKSFQKASENTEISRLLLLCCILVIRCVRVIYEPRPFYPYIFCPPDDFWTSGRANLNPVTN